MSCQMVEIDQRCRGSAGYVTWKAWDSSRGRKPGGDHGASADIQERTAAVWWTGKEEGDVKYRCTILVESRKTTQGNRMTSKLICDGREEGGKGIVKRQDQGKPPWRKCVCVCECVEQRVRGKFIEEGRYKSGNGGEMKKARHGRGECWDLAIR